MIEVDTPSGVKSIDKDQIKIITEPTSRQEFLGVGAILYLHDASFIECYHTFDEITECLKCLK